MKKKCGSFFETVKHTCTFLLIYKAEGLKGTHRNQIVTIRYLKRSNKMSRCAGQSSKSSTKEFSTGKYCTTV